ncbi:MAG: TetR/AcrR family transcriptional regulator [Eubacteriaceae bacterium]|jgi:AcrR family transcriptional regulator|nr:TetR/AcrR family transcriptional regulator [Eubacteriaceae bacterium]
MSPQKKGPGTAERIVHAALDLFSQKGYDGVSVKEIAAAVGIRDASLYKHFSSKQAIFDTIVSEMNNRLAAKTRELVLPDATTEDASSRYANLTLPDLTELSDRVFLFYLKDPFVSKYRRMLSLEQFHDSSLSDMYRQFFMEDAITYQTAVFKQLVAAGAFIPVDPKVIAVAFYAPIFFLLSRYDNRPDEEADALALLNRQIAEFYRIYREPMQKKPNPPARIRPGD